MLRIAFYAGFFFMTAGASYVVAKKQGPGPVQVRSESPSEKDGSSLVQWIPTSRLAPQGSEIRSEALALSVVLVALQ